MANREKFEEAALDHYQGEMTDLEKYSTLLALDEDQWDRFRRKTRKEADLPPLDGEDEWDEEIEDEGDLPDIEEVDRELLDLDYDEMRERIEEINAPLSVEIERTVEVTLGTGGPACGYTLTAVKNGRHWEYDSGTYWYQDWFTEKRQFHLSNDQLDKVVELYQLDSALYDE